MSDRSNADELFPDLYNELRSIAKRHLAGEGHNNTLRTTELVHEAYLRFSKQDTTRFQRSSHFLAVAAMMMRRVLVDRARSRKTAKRGGGWLRIELNEDTALDKRPVLDLLEIDDALKTLESLDPRAASIVEMRFFAGMTEAQIADVMGFSDRWVRKQWSFARAWLHRQLNPR